MQDDLLTHARVSHPEPPAAPPPVHHPEYNEVGVGAFDGVGVAAFDGVCVKQEMSDEEMTDVARHQQAESPPILRTTFNMVARRVGGGRGGDAAAHPLKYASTITINGQAYNYCQVCLYKTKHRDDFRIHFQTRQHQQVVDSLERPVRTAAQPLPARDAACSAVFTGGPADKRRASQPPSQPPSPKSKRKRTVPVACRQMVDDVASDSSVDDSDIEFFTPNRTQPTALSTPAVSDDHWPADRSVTPTPRCPSPPDGQTDEAKQPVTVTDITSQPVNPPLRTSQPVNPPVRTSQPVNPPVRTSQPVNPPLRTSQPVNPPVRTSQPVNPPVPEASESVEKRCLSCDYRYVDLNDYSRHYTSAHLNSVDVKTEPGDTAAHVFNESFVIKAGKIISHLPGESLLCRHSAATCTHGILRSGNYLHNWHLNLCPVMQNW